MTDDEELTPAHYAIKLSEDVRALIRKEMAAALIDQKSGCSYQDVANWIFVMAQEHPNFKRAVVAAMKEQLNKY